MITFIIGVFSHLEASWLNRKAEGWAWYEDKKNAQEKQNITDVTTVPKNSKERLEDIKKQLEEKLADAILNPTDENLLAYMIEQKRVLDQSAKFSRLWTRLLLDHPELDPTATSFPVSQYGIQLRKAMMQSKTRELIGRLSKQYGLFFFYEGESKISQALALVVKEFSKRNAWEVVAVSVDGTLLPSFPSSQQDNGVSKSFGIKTYPAIFMVNPKEKTAVPIAYGLASLDQIEENIALQFSEEEFND